MGDGESCTRTPCRNAVSAEKGRNHSANGDCQLPLVQAGSPGRVLRHVQKVFQPPSVQLARGYCLLQGTARLRLVGTVAELALSQVGTELPEASFELLLVQLPEPEAAHPGGVDQLAALGEGVQGGRRGRVTA